MRKSTLALAALALALSGCGKKEEAKTAEKPAAAKKSGTPARAPLQKARLVGKVATSQPTKGAMPPGHPPAGGMPPGHPPMGKGMPAGHPPAGGMPAGHPPAGGMPPGHPPAGGAAAHGGGGAGGPSGVLQGTIELGSGLEAKVKPNSVLFIVARRDAGPGQKGMALAAKRMVVGPNSFPLSFLMTGKDVMMQGTAFNGAVRLDARIDQDGDAISKQPGDVVGKAKDVVQVGDKGVKFTLDQTL